MPYCQLYYHFVWSTRNREPLLTAPVKPLVFDYIRWKAVELGGAVFALNSAADHVHLVASVLHRVPVAPFVGQVKAAASTKFNRRSPEEPLHWADEFGAMTFDGKRLPYVIAYVERQKEHHAAGTIIPGWSGRKSKRQAASCASGRLVMIRTGGKVWCGR